jgi:Ferredoxin
MIATPPSPPRVVLYEGPGSEPLATDERTAVIGDLLDRGFRVTAANAAAGSETAGACIVVGRFGGSPPEITATTSEVSLIDATGMSPEAIVERVEATRASEPMNRPNGPDTWKPWFPVIDTDRCTNCMQCLTFCLFDVYGVADDHTLRVENPANCKVNCPACSRVCPEVAIMFPKYHAGPIDGSPVRQQDVAAEKMKVDISALLGGDIYEKLRQRSEGAKARFSKERDAKQALSERRRCLTKLADAAQIPREVLDALPTPEEIERRTAAAAEKAAAALAARESRAAD